MDLPHIGILTFPPGSTRFSPVNHCIYCETQDEQLTDEHIIPLGIGGALLLPQSSCTACAAITGAFIEQQCLRQLFQHIRLRYGFPTRRPRDRPKDFAAKVHASDEILDATIQLSDLPTCAWALPYFDTLPKSLNNEPESDTTLYRIMSCFADQDAPMLDKVGGGLPVSFGELKSDLFFRMLAKIAHAFAYALLGIDGFVPHLQHFIKDGIGNVGHFIGNEPRTADDIRHVHRLELSEYCTPNGARFLTVRMNLFSFLHTPRYVVVVGESIGEKYRLLQARCYVDTIELTVPK